MCRSGDSDSVCISYSCDLVAFVLGQKSFMKLLDVNSKPDSNQSTPTAPQSRAFSSQQIILIGKVYQKGFFNHQFHLN